MRRCVLILTVVVLSACGADASKGKQSKTTMTGVVSQSCDDLSETSLSGVAAVTDGGLVRVWSTAGFHEFFDLPAVGDDPMNPPTQGDGSFVESVAVVAGTCIVFVGMCCEPAIGLTKWFKTPGTQPINLVGHLPSVSPDGTRIALVGNEQLIVTPVESPDSEGITIDLSASDSSTVVDIVWLDGDRLALLVEDDEGARLRMVVVSKKMLGPSVSINPESGRSTTEVSGISLIGVSDGDLLLGSVVDGVNVVDRRSAETLASVGQEKYSYGSQWMRRTNGHTVFISADGFLSILKDGDDDPSPIGVKYTWAG